MRVARWERDPMNDRILLLALALWLLIACEQPASKILPPLTDQHGLVVPQVVPPTRPITDGRTWQEQLSAKIIHPFDFNVDHRLLSLTIKNVFPFHEKSFDQLLLELGPQLVGIKVPFSVVVVQASGDQGVVYQATIYLKDVGAHQKGEISTPELLRRMEIKKIETVATLKMRAASQRREGLIQDSITTLKQWLLMDPQSVEAQWLLINCLRDQKEYWDAIHRAEALIRLKSDHLPTLHNLAYLYYQVGDFESSIASYQRVLELQADDFASIKGLAQVHTKNKDFNGAMNWLAKAKAHGRDAELWLIEGSLYRDQKEAAKALEAYQQGYVLDPSDHRFLYNQILVHLDQKKYPEAQKLYRQLMEVSPTLAGELKSLTPFQEIFFGDSEEGDDA